MKISCVILNYNDVATTTCLIKEIESYSALTSIVVVDNLSTDNSFEILTEYATEKIHVIRADKNGGYGHGNNIGIRYAVEQLLSDYILIANPDVHFSNDTVVAMAKFLDNNIDYAVVAPRALKPSGENQNLLAWKLQSKWDYTLSGSMIYLKYFSDKYYPESFYAGKDELDVAVVPGSLLMVTAKYMMKFGMYDANNFLYAEEEMIAIKFKKVGLKTRLLLNYTYVHEHSVSISKSFPSELKKKRMNLESRIFVLNHYYKVTNLEKKIVNVISKIAFIENTIIFKIKKLNNR